MLTVIVSYLLLPSTFLLTLILPAAVYWIDRRYVWFSIPLAVAAELIVRWSEFCYYESRGLMIRFTLVQIAVMAMVIWILKFAAAKMKK